jgi:hypothetical protein
MIIISETVAGTRDDCVGVSNLALHSRKCNSKSILIIGNDEVCVMLIIDK